MTVVLRIAAPLFPDWMCVIESNDSFAVSTMQCQRIVQPVRSLRCWRNLFYHESNPVSALRVDNESQSIQIEQRVESGLLPSHDTFRLSVQDNIRNANPYV